MDTGNIKPHLRQTSDRNPVRHFSEPSASSHETAPFHDKNNKLRSEKKKNNDRYPSVEMNRELLLLSIPKRWNLRVTPYKTGELQNTTSNQSELKVMGWAQEEKSKTVQTKNPDKKSHR